MVGTTPILCSPPESGRDPTSPPPKWSAPQSRTEHSREESGHGLRSLSTGPYIYTHLFMFACTGETSDHGDTGTAEGRRIISHYRGTDLEGREQAAWVV